MSNVLIIKESRNNNTSNIIIGENFRFVKKIIDYNSLSLELYQRELYWLRKLEYTGLVPKIISNNEDERSITMNYCGEPVSYHNKPNDSYEQLFNIQIMLLQNNCMYNDWKHGNILNNNGKLNIIDFGWCPVINEDYTCLNNVNSSLNEKPNGNFFKDIFDDKVKV